MQGLSVLKCLLIIQAALLPSLSFLPETSFWAHGILGCVPHWTAMDKIDKLSALLELTFGWKERQNPSTQIYVQIRSHWESLLRVGWSGKTPLPPEAVLFKPLAASLLSRNEYVNHYVTGEWMLWSILIIITILHLLKTYYMLGRLTGLSL